MNRISRVFGSATVIVALSACGGGGGGESSATPAPTAAKYTQSDVQRISALGVQATVLSGRSGVDAMNRLGAIVQLFSTDNGGSRVVDEPICATGTATATVSKSAVRTGLIPGDQVTMSFTQCAINGSTHVLNGTAKLTARTIVATPPGGDYAVDFEAVMTGFSIKVASGAVEQYDGVLDIKSSVIAGNAYTNGFTVPAGQTFTNTIVGASGPIALVYGSGATFAATDVGSPRSASRKLDGSVSISLDSAGAVALAINTPTALSGSTVTGGFVADSGVINTTSTGQTLETSTTFSGESAMVSGDSDGNGSLDLVFNTTWVALTAR